MKPRGLLDDYGVVNVTFFGSFDIIIFFQDPKLVYLGSFEMNWQQPYWVSSFYVGWMIGMLIYYKFPLSNVALGQWSILVGSTCL